MSCVDFEGNDSCDTQQIVFIHDYTEMKCKPKLISEFEVWENDIYDTLHACCMDRFPNLITSCCETSETSDEAGCTLSSIAFMWLPDWANGHCYEKATNLMEEWQWRWAHETSESCCSRCKFYWYAQPNNIFHCHTLKIASMHINEYLNTDFASYGGCNRRELMSQKFYATVNSCHAKAISDAEEWEEEIYDTLYACCSDRFPNSITSCCETNGEGGCPLSGIVQWLPDWANDHCYEKDTNLIEEWEWRWAFKTLDACCGRCEYCTIALKFTILLFCVCKRFLFAVQSSPYLEVVTNGSSCLSSIMPMIIIVMSKQ